MTVKTPCLRCGELIDQYGDRGALCASCKPLGQDTRPPQRYVYRESRSSTAANGRGTQWVLLSQRARRLQPWCLDCGTRSKLTADHLPVAWWKHAQGLPLDLTDVEVVCQDCNQARGSSKIGTPRYSEWVQQYSSDEISEANEYSLDGIVGHEINRTLATTGDLPDDQGSPAASLGSGAFGYTSVESVQDDPDVANMPLTRGFVLDPDQKCSNKYSGPYSPVRREYSAPDDEYSDSDIS